MRVLRLGSSGADVSEWQNFLIGKNFDLFDTGIFDTKTVASTIEFQLQNGLSSDGVVGTKTYVVAMQQGFGAVIDEHEDGLDKPIKPAGVNALSEQDRVKIFGNFAYVATPTPSNPEAIQIIDNWSSKNIVGISVPQLVKLTGKSNHKVWIHKTVQKQFIDLFQAWEDAGLIHHILTWAGCWNARFKRGSTTSLSNHSWGSAFDINVSWNQLGQRPTSWGTYGSVRELVEIAIQHGWFWGGHFKNRKDGQHFEAYRIL